MKFTILGSILISIVGMSYNSIWSQIAISKEEYQKRRVALRQSMPENSVAVFFSSPIRNRANDVDYPYHPDPSLNYLSGWKEPHAVLMIFKNPQQDSLGSFTEQLYVREKNAYDELWNGGIVGVDAAQEASGVERVLDRSTFKTSKLNLDAFDTVLIYEFTNDVRDNKYDKNDLYDLQAYFKTKIHYPSKFDATRYRLYQKIRTFEPENISILQSEISRWVNRNPSLNDDALLQDFLKLPKGGQEKELKMQSAFLVREMNFDVDRLPKLMASLREQKSLTEIQLLKKAVAISVAGQIEVMKAMHPDMSEREIQGIHEFVYKKFGAAHVGYPSIVGAGANACVLHYSHNELPEVENQMVLMDLGAEYKGYTADVTRTIPANGKFSKAQRQLYEVVYRAQEKAIQAARIGTSFKKITETAYSEVQQGLLDLGIIKEASEFRRYLPHGVSHHIGLDVHDPGQYKSLEENMVITIEPGIYIPKNSPCDPKWWNIGIRIEDDILITKNGPDNLSAAAPRLWSDIEAMMQQKSPLDDWELPEIEN